MLPRFNYHRCCYVVLTPDEPLVNADPAAVTDASASRWSLARDVRFF